MVAFLSRLIGWAVESIAHVEFHHRYLGPFVLLVVLATWLVQLILSCINLFSVLTIKKDRENQRSEVAAVHERLSDLAPVSGVETTTQEVKVAAIQEHLSALFALSEQDRDSHQAAIASLQELISEFFSASEKDGEAQQQAEVNGLQGRFLNENFCFADRFCSDEPGIADLRAWSHSGRSLVCHRLEVIKNKCAPENVARRLWSEGDLKSSARFHGGATAEQVSALEKSLGVVLPDDYKTFLCLSNGLDTLDIEDEWDKTLYGIGSVTLLESPEVFDGVETPINHLIRLCHMCRHELCGYKARCDEDGYKPFLQIMNKSPTDWPRYSRLVLVGSEGPWGKHPGSRANVYLVPPGDTKRAADLFLHTLNSRFVDETTKQDIRLSFLHNGSPCGLKDLNWLSQAQTWPVLVDDIHHSPSRTRFYPNITGYLGSMVELGSG
ncbi:hypothetical protein DL764_000446 [Monosporascus ibericus]|uniref:Knr4/Smi1-like domain-containing protein n=1 Tax=Monosporascus ibericus TaxID=155417 RepID=A0A4Q4TW48_9PEZI|nr:hypothetical protein DL764_000446 [Monosporascus ibericus]